MANYTLPLSPMWHLVTLVCTTLSVEWKHCDFRPINVSDILIQVLQNSPKHNNMAKKGDTLVNPFPLLCYIWWYLLLFIVDVPNCLGSWLPPFSSHLWGLRTLSPLLRSNLRHCLLHHKWDTHGLLHSQRINLKEHLHRIWKIWLLQSLQFFRQFCRSNFTIFCTHPCID